MSSEWPCDMESFMSTFIWVWGLSHGQLLSPLVFTDEPIKFGDSYREVLVNQVIAWIVSLVIRILIPDIAWVSDVLIQ